MSLQLGQEGMVRIYRCMLGRRRGNAGAARDDPVELYALIRGGQEGDISKFAFVREVEARGFNVFLPLLGPIVGYMDDIVITTGGDMDRMSADGVILMDRVYSFNDIIQYLDTRIVVRIDLAAAFDMIDI